MGGGLTLSNLNEGTIKLEIPVWAGNLGTLHLKHFCVDRWQQSAFVARMKEQLFLNFHLSLSDIENQ